MVLPTSTEELDLNFHTPQIMGILNVTPDSFSDGGEYLALNAALSQAANMANSGADIIDIGGESTRPGASAVTVEEELQRVIPVVEAIHKNINVIISVDTSKPEVMEAAVNAGAGLINDVRALQEDGAMAMAALLDVPVSLMHMQGQPRTMQESPDYEDVTDDVIRFLRGRIADCELAGIPRSNLLIDPGFGFGKRLEHNYKLLRELHGFKSLDLPLLVGISRKSMVGAVLDDAPVGDRVWGSVGAAVVAVERGADIVRVHDVKETREALLGAGLLREQSA